jgi:hypothetical protein
MHATQALSSLHMQAALNLNTRCLSRDESSLNIPLMVKYSGAFGSSAGLTLFHSSPFCRYWGSTDDVAPYRQGLFLQQVLVAVLESQQEK